MPYLYPAIPDAHKLWLKDSTLQGMTISDARKEVNELFKTAILELAGTPPLRSTVSPFHQGHAVKEIAVCYGAKSPIDRIGVWYAKCTCHNAVQWLHRAVGETILFFDDRINRLLFMREELKPKPTNDVTARDAYDSSIERSICYHIAFSDMYPDIAGQVHEVPDEDVSTPSPTKSSPANTRKRPSTGRPPSNRPTKRQSNVFAENTSPSPVKQQHHSSPAAASHNTASSSQLTARAVDRMPIFIIAWIQNGVDPVVVAARTRPGDMFSLMSQKHILKANGITRSAFPILERYATDGTWVELLWDSTFGPMKMGQPVLLRARGLSNLADFVWMKVLAQI